MRCSDGDARFTLTERHAAVMGRVQPLHGDAVALRGADLLHVKGLLNVAGCRGPVVVQFMQHLALPPVELQAWPDDDRASRIEFVTRNIDGKRSVRDLFDAVRALA